MADLENAQAALTKQATHDALTGLAEPRAARRPHRPGAVRARSAPAGAPPSSSSTSTGSSASTTRHGHAAGDDVLRTVADKLVAVAAADGHRRAHRRGRVRRPRARRRQPPARRRPEHASDHRAVAAVRDGRDGEGIARERRHRRLGRRTGDGGDPAQGSRHRHVPGQVARRRARRGLRRRARPSDPSANGRAPDAPVGLGRPAGSSSTTSRSSTSPPGPSPASRRSPGSSARRLACSRRPTSSPSPRTAASSCRSARRSSRWLRRRRAAGRRRTRGAPLDRRRQPLRAPVRARRPADGRARQLEHTGLDAELPAPRADRDRDHRSAIPTSCEQLGRIRDLGVQIGLDDFGTGYASLDPPPPPAPDLRQDRPVVRARPRSRPTRTSASSSAVVDLAANLGLRSIAEGVETTDQLDRLRELGCDQAQGYLFARPLPPEELVDAVGPRAG